MDKMTKHLLAAFWRSFKKGDSPDTPLQRNQSPHELPMSKKGCGPSAFFLMGDKSDILWCVSNHPSSFSSTYKCGRKQNQKNLQGRGQLFIIHQSQQRSHMHLFPFPVSKSVLNPNGQWQQYLFFFAIIEFVLQKNFLTVWQSLPVKAHEGQMLPSTFSVAVCLAFW